MQIQTDKRNLLLIGDMETEEFKVEATGHMMEILSGLYSDIPWAIVREYGTNMLDGYIALPADAKIIPPQIHLPTTLEPYIEFKDFGIGMDFETVWKIYKTYGASTKTGNNEEVGGFGLGAKTAFCYDGCDSWAVESRFNGKRMIFNATRNEKGVPSLFHVDTLDTKEPNGVTVRVPVAIQDFGQFRNAVAKLVQFYPMDVKVTGDAGFTVPKNEYILKGRNWALRKGNDPQVIMGNVPYPLDLSQVFSRHYRMDRVINSFAVDIRMPIGAVQIVPSREALKYTERTVDRVAQVINEFYAEVGEVAGALIDEQKTEWDALKFLSHFLGNTLVKYLSNVSWNGKVLDATRGICFDIDELQKTYPDLVVEKFEVQPYKSSINRTILTGGKHFLSPVQTNLFSFIDDLGKGMIGRVRNHMKRQSGAAVTYIFRAQALTRKGLGSTLGGFPVGLVSEFPAPPRNASRPRKVAQVKLLDKKGWVDAEVDVEEGGYFIRLSAQGGVDIEGVIPISDFSSIAKKLGVMAQDVPVYGIPRTRKSMESEDGWVDLVAEMKPKVEKIVEQKSLQIARCSVFDSMQNSSLARFLGTISLDKLKEGSVAHEVTGAIQGIGSIRDEIRDLTNMARSLRIPVPSGTAPGESPKELIAKLEQTYPMIRVVCRSCYSHTSLSYSEKEIIEYMALVDASRVMAETN